MRWLLTALVTWWRAQWPVYDVEAENAAWDDWAAKLREDDTDHG